MRAARLVNAVLRDHRLSDAQVRVGAGGPAKSADRQRDLADWAGRLAGCPTGTGRKSFEARVHAMHDAKWR
jgi:hypothetical protein